MTAVFALVGGAPPGVTGCDTGLFLCFVVIAIPAAGCQWVMLAPEVAGCEVCHSCRYAGGWHYPSAPQAGLTWEVCWFQPGMPTRCGQIVFVLGNCWSQLMLPAWCGREAYLEGYLPVQMG